VTDRHRNVVVWSGGADSTALLDWYASTSSKATPTLALSIASHPYLHKDSVKAQNTAQEAYLKYARRKGYHIQHKIVKVSGKFDWGGPTSGTAQSIVWLFAIAQVLQDDDIVLMGYIRKDDFWHYRDKFVALFDAMCAYKDVKAKIQFPLEWDTKSEVIGRLRNAKVPNKCWTSCDNYKGKKPCGVCSKCITLKEACEGYEATKLSYDQEICKK
jgi:7-cyano-7-deazaguanine synthase in queuosine biosynthesis